MVPVAPALFSTMTVVFQMSCSFCAMMRARMSVPPPGEKPTMMRIGPAGMFCARTSGAAMVAATAVVKVLRFTVLSPWVLRNLSGFLEHGRCGMGSEEIHRGLHAGARELHVRELQAHLAAGQRGHQREVIAVAE